MGSIFISYRRSDTAGYAGRLQERLNAQFGPDKVFRDIDTLKPGVDFVDAVERAVSSCTVLIALIGSHWQDASASNGRRRIDEENDYPRMEIGTALANNVLVIPVLVEGARMPEASELPEPLQRLARIQALEISDRRWEYDVGQLLAQLEGVMREDSGPVAPVEPSPPPPAEPVPVSAPIAPPVPEVFPGVRTSAGGPAEAASANAYAIASLVLGVASVVTGILGLPFGIAALATGVRGRRSLKPAYATAGMITGALGSVISIVVLLLILVLWATSPKQ